jgi:hypothetical protein
MPELKYAATLRALHDGGVEFIAIKEQLGGEKDRAVLPILRRTLEEKRKVR